MSISSNMSFFSQSNNQISSNGQAVISNNNNSLPASSNTSSAPIRTYSLMSELSESDIAEYKAENFTMGRIPRLPPPREFCF